MCLDPGIPILASHLPLGWCVTPRKPDDPRANPWLCLRIAMTSSSSPTLCMKESSSEYLLAGKLSFTLRAPLVPLHFIAATSYASAACSSFS